MYIVMYMLNRIIWLVKLCVTQVALAIGFWCVAFAELSYFGMRWIITGKPVETPWTDAYDKRHA